MEIAFDVTAFAVKHEAEKKCTRMVLIARVFEYDKFLGVDEKLLKRNPFYYNDQFDTLYEMNLYDLEDFEEKLHGLVSTYGDILNKQNKK